MKILIITPYWINTKGGITTVAVSLSETLRRMGHRVFVLSPDGGPGSEKLPRRRFFMALGAVRTLAKLSPDAIHIHGHGSLLFPTVLYKIIFNRRVKIIFTFHTQPHAISYLTTGKPLKERGIFRQFIFNSLLKHCDATTYVSKSLMDSLSKSGIKIINPFVILNGVLAKEIKLDDVANFKRKYNLDNNYPILCMIASFAWDWKIKGIEILLEAFKKVLISKPKSKLLIIGDGQYRKHLEDCIKKGNLKEDVIFTGMMDNPFITLSICDIYCHISLNEACGIAPLEAMIAGKPVIASNDGGLSEIIINGLDGILVDSNPDSVTKAILMLLDDSNLMQSLSKNAIITATSKFSWDIIAREYEKLY